MKCPPVCGFFFWHLPQDVLLPHKHWAIQWVYTCLVENLVRFALFVKLFKSFPKLHSLQKKSCTKYRATGQSWAPLPRTLSHPSHWGRGFRVAVVALGRVSLEPKLTCGSPWPSFPSLLRAEWQGEKPHSDDFSDFFFLRFILIACVREYRFLGSWGFGWLWAVCCGWWELNSGSLEELHWFS